MDKSAKILIVEDDIDLVEALKVTLGRAQYDVLSAYDPEVGFEIAKREMPDLIILDVLFGEREETRGFDYAQKIRQDQDLAPIPILMLTSINVRRGPGFHFSPESDKEYLPVDDFIDKPAQPEELVKKVKRLLKRKTSRWVNWPNE